jgi:hypothetical protein
MAHADQRFRERTSLPRKELVQLRRALKRARLSPGAHHYRFSDGSSAVLKPVRRRHVVATVLSRNMQPPGQNVAHLLKVASPWAWLARWALQG